MHPKVVFPLLALFLCQTLACKLLPRSNDTYLCESLEDLRSSGSHPEWKKLVMKNSGNQEKKSLENGIFGGVPNLENLWIEGLVNKLEPDVFKNLVNLKMLHSIGNEIEELPEAIFEGLDIKVLELKQSGLNKIYPNTLSNIEYVSLEGNHINPGTIFRNSNITSLNLSNNSISDLEDCAFCGMKNLMFLSLHFNNLKSIDPARILGDNTPLFGLGLDGNHLKTIPSFQSLQSLRGITVANNSIETIEDNSFVNSQKFGLLDVSFNKLKEIPVNIFSEIGDEEDPVFLVIHGNKIECLSKELRDKIKKLRRLTVEKNNWNCDCLSEAIKWAKGQKAFVGCDIGNHDCKVDCVDENGQKQIVHIQY